MLKLQKVNNYILKQGKEIRTGSFQISLTYSKGRVKTNTAMHREPVPPKRLKLPARARPTTPHPIPTTNRLQKSVR